VDCQGSIDEREPGTRKGWSLDKSGTYYISPSQIKIDRALEWDELENSKWGERN